MYNEPILKRKKRLPNGLYIALIAFVSLLTIGISYAFFIYYGEGNNHVAIAGDIFMESTNSGNVSLTGLYPMTNEDGIENGIKYNFDVSGYNLSNKTIYYGVYVNEGDEITGKTRFKDNDIKLYLTKTVGDETSVVYGPNTLEDFNGNMIYASTIDPNIKEEDAIDISYELTIWIDEKVLISDSVTSMDGRSIYTPEQYKNSYASVKVEVYGDFQEKELPIIGYITYDMSSLGITNPSSTPIYSDNTGTVTSEITSTTLTNFLGWSTTLNGEVVYEPGAQINASDIVNNNITLYPVMKKEYLVDKITSTISLTEADVDGTRFVYGEVDNNYVWYSGKLWRIVGINSDGSIKLVTQGNMTTIAWNTTSSTDYSTSQMRTWLNNEFLPTLYDAENLLVDHEWDYTTYTDFPTEKITENTTKLTGEDADKVGLLNIYEYMMTGGTTSSETSNTFLNNGYDCWTITPQSTFSVWYTMSSGGSYQTGVYYTNSIRPSINLKSGIMILDGTGEKNNPYTIEGDKETGTTSELLSNRISGEYINFNNTKYRIVGIEEISGETLTKITMADYDINNNTIGDHAFLELSELEESLFNNSVGVKPFVSKLANEAEPELPIANFSESSGIGLYLKEWYNNEIDTNYKNMIATPDDGVVWYQGPDDGVKPLEDFYTFSKTGTGITATIGLPYYGELFSCHYTESENFSEDIWLMTKYAESEIIILNSSNTCDFSSPSLIYGVRPSFYLKSDVKITGGTGQSGSPYEISQ